MLEIDQEGRFLSLYRGFVKISDHGAELGRVPLDEVGALVISAQGATVSKGLLVELAERGEVTILCDGHYLPSAMVWPYQEHSNLADRLHLQIDASLPLRKQLWRAVIQAKLTNQGWAIAEGKALVNPMVGFVEAVKSGDSNNREAAGAQFYWPRMFGQGFHRNDDEAAPNSRLNFAYALVRSSMARAVCAAGLHPALSLFHRQKGNLFALADDLMEPYRPFADVRVKASFLDFPAGNTLDRPVKKFLCELLARDVSSPRGTTPLANAVTETVRTLIHSYETKKPGLWFPRLDEEPRDEGGE